MDNSIKARRVAINLVEEVFEGKHGKITNIKAIHNGYTNKSYMVTFADATIYQVRIPHCGNLLNRNNELKILSMLGDQKFPYFDAKTGIAIKEWIHGKCPKIPRLWQWRDTDQLFYLIKKLHSLKLPEDHQFKTLNFDSYNDNLYRLKLQYQLKYLSIIDNYSEDPLVFNHTDINAQNMVIDNIGKLHLIDYEWCGMAPDYWDYANFIRESGILYTHIKWDKYIPKFDMQKLKNYIYVAAVYAYLWTWKMPDSIKIRKYRRETLQQIKRAYRGVK